MSGRIPKVNQLIKKELGSIIAKEVESSLGTIVTITRVETSPDLQETKVYISSIPDSKLAAALKSLRERVGWLQHLFNKRVNMRPVPKIMFLEETKTKEAARVEKLLENIHGRGSVE